MNTIERERDDPKSSEVSELRAHVAALEQLLEVYERTVAEQAGKLEDALSQLDQHAADLKRSNQELELFAYVASHDLQEPLRMVASYTQLLATRYGDRLDDDARDFISFAVDGARRMQALIEGLLQYSRAGTRALSFVPTDLNESLRGALSNLSLAIDDAGATITSAELPMVKADPAQMTQLFQNLIANALKFRSEAPPEIVVTAEQVGERHTIGIRDNGIGIDPRFFERIFLIFQRLHAPGEYAGTGIGLAICKKIVERHGGQLGVDSAPGRGATFHFTLPAMAGESK